MKKCYVCKESKTLSEFNKKGSGLQAKCRQCSSKIAKEHYQANAKSYVKRAKASKVKIRECVQKLKEKPCLDCDKVYPYYVMDFDHRDPNTKFGSVSSLLMLGSLDRVLEEIEKCDLVCANCHRIRSFKQRKNTKSSKRYR